MKPNLIKLKSFKRSSRTVVVTLIHLVSVISTASIAQENAQSEAQSEDSQLMTITSNAEQSAIAALDEFIGAWNTGDIDQVRATLNYPHVTHAPQRLMVAQQAEDFDTDFAQMRRSGWARSSFGDMDVIQSSENKVHLKTSFSRYNEADEVYAGGEIFYVVTNVDGHWGMQYRTPGAQLSQSEETSQQQAIVDASIAAATATIDEFFLAFNSRDNDALRAISHVPQVMFNNGLTLQASSIESAIVKMNFDALSQREDWFRSDYVNKEVINALPEIVTFRLDFQRYNSRNEKYAVVPVVWVLSQRNDNWGIEFRSLMPNSLAE